MFQPIRISGSPSYLDNVPTFLWFSGLRPIFQPISGSPSYLQCFNLSLVLRPTSNVPICFWFSVLPPIFQAISGSPPFLQCSNLSLDLPSFSNVPTYLWFSVLPLQCSNLSLVLRPTSAMLQPISSFPAFLEFSNLVPVLQYISSSLCSFISPTLTYLRLFPFLRLSLFSDLSLVLRPVSSILIYV